MHAYIYVCMYTTNYSIQNVQLKATRSIANFDSVSIDNTLIINYHLSFVFNSLLTKCYNNLLMLFFQLLEP